jgi:hypothetical protein
MLCLPKRFGKTEIRCGASQRSQLETASAFPAKALIARRKCKDNVQEGKV